MSDSAAPVVAEGPAPSSSGEIAASVIESAEQQDSSSDSGDTRIDTTNAVEATTEAKAPTQAELSAAAQFLQKQGHKAKSIDGRDTWLKYSTVEKMLDNYVAPHRTSWDTEKQTFQSRTKELEGFIEALQTGVRGDPRAFLEEIAGIDPRYRSFLEQQAAQQQQIPAAADDPMPKPDYPLGDGRFTYSVEGLQKRDEWVERQLTRKIESKLDERLRPIAEREKAEQQRAQQQQVQQQAVERTQSQLEDAKTWPGFAAHEADILKALQEDSAKARAEGKRPALSLEAAYRQVVVTKLTEDANATRQRLLKELNDAPKGTAIARSGVESTKAAGPRSSVDVARATISRLENLT